MNTEEWTWVHDPHGHHIRPVSNSDCVAHTNSLPNAEQIIQEHNAVAFAVRSGENWTLTDWQNWRRFHAIPQSLMNHAEQGEGS